MQRISKRLEALERAAENEVFATNGPPYAIAYYLGGARDLSEVLHAHARALGYQGVDGLNHAFADLLCQPSDSVDKPSDLRTRAHHAVCKLLKTFGYDPRRTSPAAFADAVDRIVRTLPEEWRAAIKSGHREWCESELRAKRILEVAKLFLNG
jgi:hypothetical protein